MSEEKKLGMLVVDDQSCVRSVVATVLRIMGFSCAEADSGANAVEWLRASSDDLALAIVDISMPGMDGLQTARLLLEERPALKIAFMTGNDANETRLRYGLNDDYPVIRKPFTAPALSKTIKEILEIR